MTDGIRLTRELVHEMVQHCKSERPNEACGLLASENGEVVKVFPMKNASRSPVRYSLDAREQLAVYRELQQNGWELGAVFHSHTRTEAVPSPTDVGLASEDVPYLIVSLASEPPEIRAFRIVKRNWMDLHGDVTEVPVKVIR